MDIIKSQTCLVFEAEEKEVMEETCCVLEYLRDTMRRNRYTSILNNGDDDCLLEDDVDIALDTLHFLLKSGLTID